jgi:glycosyltransferase involved in cell wall biosynthesis
MKVSISCPTRFHAFYLADQLDKRGALHHLYTSFYGRWGSRRNDLGVEIPMERVRTHPVSAFLQYVYNPLGDLAGSRFFGQWVARQLGGEDIVTTWGLSALPIIKRAHELGMITIVERGSSHATFQRDILIEEYEKWGQPTRALRRSFSAKRMEQELLEYELADYVSIPSSFAERTFLQNGISKDKLITVPYGVSLTEFKPLPKWDPAFRVVYAGGMTLRKGVHYLLQAFHELKLPEAELWLLGGDSPEIKPFFKRYEGSFQHLGQVSQANLYQYYSQGSVFVMNSIEDGFGLVVPQAMACGLPVICSVNAGASDLVDEYQNGFCVPIRDVEALKEKILFLYEHPDICQAMGQRAREKIKSGYAWDDYGEKIHQAYQGVLAHARGRSPGFDLENEFTV